LHLQLVADLLDALSAGEPTSSRSGVPIETRCERGPLPLRPSAVRKYRPFADGSANG
jgi:hypothetical protein